MEKEVHLAKLEFNKLMVEISFKTNKIESIESVLPELSDLVCKLNVKTEKTSRELKETLGLEN